MYGIARNRQNYCIASKKRIIGVLVVYNKMMFFLLKGFRLEK